MSKKKSGYLGNKEAQALLRDLDKLRENQKVIDMRTVMARPEGRRFLMRLMDDCNTFGKSFAGTTNESIYEEGRRGVGVDLMVDLQRADPNLYIQALNEELIDRAKASLSQDSAVSKAETETEDGGTDDNGN